MGFWHGANWTFVLWGLCTRRWSGRTASPSRSASAANVVPRGRGLPLHAAFEMLAWIFFRAQAGAFTMIGRAFDICTIHTLLDPRRTIT